MEFIIEFFAELLMDVTIDTAIDATKNRRLPKPVRYLIAILLALVFFAIIALVYIVGAKVWEQSVICGILILAIGVLLTVCCIRWIVGICKQIKRTKTGKS